MWKQRFWKLTGMSAIAAAVAVTTSPAVAQEPETERGVAEAGEELADAQVTLEVDGMSCPFCAYGLEKRLREIDAIEDLVIRVSDGLVRIRLREGATLTDEELDEAVTRAGFSLREIRRRDS